MIPVRYPRNKILAIIALTTAIACTPEPAPEPEAASPACGEDGRLTARLYGAIDTDIDWRTPDLACEGMPRPEGEGARLRFSGPLEDAQDSLTVAFILGIPDLTEGSTGRELPTNVTLVQEGAGRFFATADTDGCWTDVHSHNLLRSGTATYEIAGTVYCLSPLAELNGNASVNFTELAFSGRIRWEFPE